MRVTYGIEIDDELETDYLAMAEEAMSSFSSVFAPGKYLVESWPCLLSFRDIFDIKSVPRYPWLLLQRPLQWFRLRRSIQLRMFQRLL